MFELEENSVTLSPNTKYAKDKDIHDLWGLSADADTSNELVEGRGETIKKWFTDRGVNPSQINISITNSNYKNAVNVTGNLKAFK